MLFQRCNAVRVLRYYIPACLILASCLLLSTRLLAAELVELALNQDQGVYHLRLEMILDASHGDVHDVVTDFVHIYRLNPSIIDSEILHSPDNTAVRVRTVLNDCIMVFCKEVHRVEDVRELESGDIYAHIIPELSNIKSGITIWQIQPMSGRTRIHYSMRLEPGFFIPPLIGTYLVKQRLKQEILVSLENIERIAQILAAQ